MGFGIREFREGRDWGILGIGTSDWALKRSRIGDVRNREGHDFSRGASYYRGAALAAEVRFLEAARPPTQALELVTTVGLSPTLG
jgi:hypothetical protein